MTSSLNHKLINVILIKGHQNHESIYTNCYSKVIQKYNMVTYSFARCHESQIGKSRAVIQFWYHAAGSAVFNSNYKISF